MNGIFSSAIETPDFGNGRFARNLLEQASMAQASRLAELTEDAMTDEMMSTLCPDDFILPPTFGKTGEVRHTIGFSA